ncbi:hypothetical protein AKO1_007345 [Acrasis kona]|uniref:YrhK domain-containing protein n=1 Tax=Acrasis kona TaxID=1008807 RepID=A0AAW2YS01_9EUKA
MIKSWKSILLAASYIVGSVAFLVGSILFFPRFTADPVTYGFAIALFIVGSFLFFLPATYDWWTNYNLLKTFNLPVIPAVATPVKPKVVSPASPIAGAEVSTDGSCNGELTYMEEETRVVPLQLPASYYLENHAVSMTRSTISVFNGILFIVGSVAYWPTFNQLLLGNWTYRIASTMTCLSNLWAIYRTFYPSHNPPRVILLTRLFHIQFLIGGLGYFIGGFLFLFKYQIHGAIFWIIGSTFFITGSLQLLIM